MPLLFNSLSHGDVAFGFFNIETDMLLLETYFFFASEFCAHVADLASCRPLEDCETAWSVYVLQHRQIGNLMGAIHGFDHSGFIGEVYRLLPFPADANAFKQNPDGYRTQTRVRGLIERYQKPRQVPVTVDGVGEKVHIGGFVFSRTQFHDLLHYVWKGGYPRWKNESRPGYVLEMARNIAASAHPIFSHLRPFN